MSDIWQLQEAKNRFSEVVDEALRHGPQVITRHGEQTAVIISHEHYRKLMLQQQKLSAFFRESPLADVELDLSRDRTLARDDVRL